MGNTTPLPTLPEPSMKTLRLIWAKVKITPSGCWEWTAGVRPDGYPNVVTVNNSLETDGHQYLPYRLFYAWFKHDIPEGLTIDHLCGNKLCLNPDHLEPVTFSENRMRAHAKCLYCKRGHPLADPNLYYYGPPKANGKRKRRCLACIKGEWAARKKAN